MERRFGSRNGGGSRDRGFGGGGSRGGFGGGGRDRGFGGGGGGRFSDKPKPVKVGEEYDVTINDVGAKGDGITKIENFIIFVAGVSKGETCRIRIKEVANKFAIAEKVGAATGEASTKSEAKEESEEQEEGSDSYSSDSDEEQ